MAGTDAKEDGGDGREHKLNHKKDGSGRCQLTVRLLRTTSVTLVHILHPSSAITPVMGSEQNVSHWRCRFFFFVFFPLSFSSFTLQRRVFRYLLVSFAVLHPPCPPTERNSIEREIPLRENCTVIVGGKIDTEKKGVEEKQHVFQRQEGPGESLSTMLLLLFHSFYFVFDPDSCLRRTTRRVR